MAHRNLAGREDIEPDVLRQRRDLYAIAIGLVLYYLAGGHISDSLSLASVMPIKLTRPEVLLGFAWIGFSYFWFRFWLVCTARPFADLLEDARWQAGSTQSIRRIAAKLANPTPSLTIDAAREQLLSPDGPVPRPGFSKEGAYIQLDRLFTPAQRRAKPVQISVNQYGPRRGLVSPEDKSAFIYGWVVGWFGALTRERTFTDYTVPHLFAIGTVGIGLFFGCAC